MSKFPGDNQVPLTGKSPGDNQVPLTDRLSHNTDKPPAPQKSSKIFGRINLRSLRKKHKLDIMGQACTKRAKVDCKKAVVFSPRGRSNKVSPFKSNPTPELSVDQISLQGGSNLKLHRNSVDEERMAATQFENENIPKTIVEEEVSDCKENEDERDNSISSKSNNSNDRVSSLVSSASNSPSESVKNLHTSVPNLRPKLSPFKRVNRSCSHGDVRFKKSFGSSDLINKQTFLKEDSSAEIPRHHSVENVLNVERRKKKTPTKENGIHNLEADQVNYYHLLEEVGRGSFGSIYRCHSTKDNKYYAMKVMSKRRLMRKSGLAGRRPNKKHNPLEPLHREIAILKKMDHPNIVKLLEVMDDLQVDNVYMVFELMTNGVVIEVPTEKTIPEERSRRLFRELLLGIEYLHYSKIIHRDIKPANLLLDNDDHIKIADFGVSDIFEGENDLLSKYAGSPAFQSPEVLNHESRDKYSGKAADVWAMGVTLFCFLYGKCPFYSTNMGEIITKIKEEPLAFPDTPIVNPQAQDLISRMLAKDPKERITIIEMKEHHWVTDGGTISLPQTEQHCSVIEVTEEDVKNSVKIISKLSSLVFAKSILKGRSFVSGRTKNSWKRNHSLPTPDL